MARNPGANISCAACGEVFYVPHNRKDTAKYCSRQCSGAGQVKRGTKCCETCGENFDFIATRANTAKYCSRKCYYLGMKGRGSVTYKCQHCEKEFLGSPSHKRKFCSRTCVGKAGKRVFHTKFTTVRKAMSRRGQISSCNRCGFDAHPEILGVHHKDRNRSNNSMSNLEVLCPNCHSIEHSKHIVHAGKGAKDISLPS